jgi:pimeloyl-ACP methyl ester carboxylesterase
VSGFAAAVADYIKSARLNRPALIGHSMGGTIGMMIAARHPQLLSRLMVVDMIPFVGAMFGPPGTTKDSVRPIADRVRDTLAAGKGAAREKAISDTIATMVKTEGRRAEAVRHSVDSDAGLSARSMHELIVTDLRPELANIKVPVTVLYVRAPNVPFNDEQLDAFYKASFATVPQAKLKRIPDAYHFIMWDQPEAFANEVKAFLKS